MHIIFTLTIDTNLTLGISSISLENEDIKYNFTIRVSINDY